MFEQQKIRRFSKEFSEEERNETAAKIREKRMAHFDRNNELGVKIDALVETCKSTELSLETLEQELSDIETELSEREQSSLGRLLDFIGLHKRLYQLKQDKAAKETEQLELEGKYEEIKIMIGNLESSRLDRSHLDAAKQVLVDFYSTQEKALAEFIAEQEMIRSVSAISEKHQAIFLHGIHPTFVPDNNSLLHRSVDWQTKLDIFLAFNPTISASTILKGDGTNRMWARQGCILTGGLVLDAASGDAGTVAETVGGRNTSGRFFKRKMSDNDIYSAVHFRRFGHNEFVVARPKIAGFFICREKNDRNLPDLAPISEIIAECKKLDIPLFEIKSGQVWETALTPDGNDIEPTRALDTSGVLEKEFSISELDREKLENEILSDSPFTAIPSEGKYVISSANGRELYILLNKDEFLKKAGQEDVFSDPSQKSPYGLENGSRIKVLDQFPTLGGKIRYIATESGELFRHSISSYLPKSAVNPGSDGKRNIRSTDLRPLSNGQISMRGSRYITLSYNTHDVGRTITDTHAYLIGMEESIREVEKKISEPVNEKFGKAQKERIRIGLEEWINQLVFHLYGFAEQAKSCGNNETAQRAFEIIEKVMPPDRCREIIERRIDSDGRFRIKKEEIKK